MKVSIITATYNAENTIASAIESVKSQDYKNIEYIIIDGASNDNTNHIISNYKDFITHYVSEPDKGIYDALNKGLKKASGDVIGFLHADDLFKSTNTIQHIVEALGINKTNGVYGDLEYVDSQNTDKVVRFWKSKNFKHSLLKTGWMPAHPTLFLRKELYTQYGFFDTQYKIAADYDFILRVFKNKTLRFTYLPEVITQMRLGGASNKNLQNVITKTKEDINAIRTNKIGGLYTIFFKNISKLPQFFKRN